MTENASSQTISSGETHISATNESCIQNSLAAVERYQKGELTKSDSISQIRAAFALTMDGDGRVNGPALFSYFDMLNEIDVEWQRAQSQEPSGTLDVRRSLSTGPRQTGGTPELGEPSERRIKGKGRRAESEESEEQEDILPVAKRKRSSVNEDLFPWGPSSIVLQEALPPDLRSTLTLLEDWANDPNFVVQKILLSPGLAIDLDKVLGAHYSTEVNTKHSHDIGDLFQIAIKLPKQTKAIKSHGDWVITFGKTVQATTFALPQRSTEYSAWFSYMSQLFASIRPSFHDRIIKFNKVICAPFISPPMAWVQIPQISLVERDENAIRDLPMRDNESHATNGIEAPVTSQQLNANTSTAVIVATAEDPIDNPIALPPELNDVIGEGQRFRRKLVWGTNLSARSRTVQWTEFAEPLPSPPAKEFLNIQASNTIRSYPHLFVVSTPIDVDQFQSLLSSHPNQPFILSVCRGLREGFWSFADTHYGEWPTTWDNSHRPTKSSTEASFLASQIDEELAAGRYSSSFGSDLLPGMYSMPIHAVPKSGTDKHRLVTDHSAGQYALNRMISREDIAGVTLDNVQDLGNALQTFRRDHGDEPLSLWKADVSEAYRHMPMHPLWQIKQVVSFNGQRYVDRRNVFGGRASQRIFHAFMSLVIWIAIMKLLILFLFIYVDDSFSFQRAGQLTFYKKYGKALPSNLVKLL
ncbi:hypothetical protein PAXRUDRAFT_19224, partial [Paxillus rubicundulus Ve08.2h10]